MKSILIVFTGSMELGGIEKSLLGLLDEIDYSRYEVDLFLYGHHGPLFQYINKNVNLLPEITDLAYLRDSILAKFKHRAYYSCYRRIVDGIRHVSFDESWHKVVEYSVNAISKKYDLAIGFFLPFDLIIDKVNASKKVGWIHTDYRNSNEDNVEYIRYAYHKMDQMIAVSDTCKDNFIYMFPEYTDKVITIENILSKEYVLSQADAFDVQDELINDGSIKILSIGRYTYAKNFDQIPRISSLIRKRGINITWYIIGYGKDEELIKEKIQQEDVSDSVILLGKKENPYPYIKACDVYIQPSRYEGKCVSVREAQMLSKPVIITSYSTAKSQLEDGVDGAIVPIENEECASAIANLLNNQPQLKKFANNCRMRDYSNRDEIKKIEQMI